MKAVIKIGGFAFPGRPETLLVKEYAKLLTSLTGNNRLVIVAGGGETARAYIRVAREMGVSESLCDQLGILASRLNARVLVDGLGDHAFPEIPVTIGELKHYFTSGKVVAMGGLSPGHSTNAVAAIAAETVGAELLVNATDVDGVYSADPGKDRNAKRLEKVTVTELREILSKTKIMAGEYDLMDPLALRIIERSKLRTIVVNGTQPNNVALALQNAKVGTEILHG